MPTPSRIYRVFDTVSGDDHLVRAYSQAQAIRVVVGERYGATVAGQEAIVEHLTSGGKVIDATREPEQAHAA